MKRLLIIGAGGHGRVVADIAKQSGRYEEIVFIDDAEIQASGSILVLGKTKDLDAWLGESEAFVAIGDNQTRARIMEMLERKAVPMPTLIHPRAVIANGVQIGPGSVVMANAVVNCGSRLGKGVIVNTGATVDHDNELGDYVHISPGGHLGGTVRVGAMTWIGIGAVVRNNVDICEGCMVGAGAVVVKCMEQPGTYVGVPARIIQPRPQLF